MTMRLVLKNQLDPTGRCHLPDDSQELSFDHSRVVGLVDRGGEPVDDVLELRVIKTMATHAARQQVSNVSAEPQGQSSSSRFRLAGGRTTLEHSVLTAMSLRFGILPTLWVASEVGPI